MSEEETERGMLGQLIPTETLYAQTTVGERLATESVHSFTCPCVHIQQQRMQRCCCAKASGINNFSQPRLFAYILFLCLSSVWLILCAQICVFDPSLCYAEKAFLTQRRQTRGVLSDNDTTSLIINIYTSLSFRGIECTQGIKRDMTVSHGGFS